jgi:hypothetical protein
METTSKCPRCLEGRLRSWTDLDDEERQIVLRLPGSAQYSKAERQSHRWCTRCWHEVAHPAPDIA